MFKCEVIWDLSVQRNPFVSLYRFQVIQERDEQNMCGTFCASSIHSSAGDKIFKMRSFSWGCVEAGCGQAAVWLVSARCLYKLTSLAKGCS